MKTKIYVDWYEREVMSEKEFQNRVNEIMEDIIEDERSFSEICEKEFSAFELFHMDSENKDDIEKVESVIRESVKDDLFSDGWEEIEIEIEI